MKTLTIIASLLIIPLENQWGKFGKSIEDRDPLGACFHFAFLVLYILALSAATIWLFSLVWRYWEYLTIPAGIVWIIYYYANKQPKAVPAPVPQPMAEIEAIRANAENQYLAMHQSAFILLTDLCRYFSGLTAPASLTSILMPGTDIDISPKGVARYPFVINKGTCISPLSEIRETIDKIVDQHLMAHDLPLNIDDTYPAADGGEWPGLVVDGVYDLGGQYRVDFIITDEAEAAVLREKKARKTTTTIATPCDPDFD